MAVSVVETYQELKNSSLTNKACQFSEKSTVNMGIKKNQTNFLKIKSTIDHPANTMR